MEHIASVIDACPNELSGSSSQLFFALLQALVTSRCSFKTDYPSDYSSQLADGDEYDFIIVGAGSAGCILANRLSEVSHWKVLLLEAGTYPSLTTEIPMLFRHIQKSGEDWNYHTERSDTCGMSLKNNICEYPRGKVLGGSSSINAVMYVRSTKQDHDDWVKAGNTNWDYATALKHYEKVEDQLKITKVAPDTPIKATLTEGYKQLGYKEHDADKISGYGDIYSTIAKDGTRTSSAKAFLPDTKNRANIHLALNSHVTKVTLDRNNRATGVQALINNRIVHIKSKKEVILSAGSFNSPQILMHSGIGPEEHLSQLGISTRKNLRVGENLQDHVVFLGLLFNVDNSVLPAASEKDNLDAIYNYFIHRTGPLVSHELLSYNLYTDTKNDSRYRNLAIHHVAQLQNDPEKVKHLFFGFNYPQNIVKMLVENNKNSSGILLFPKALTTQSRGKVLLRSKDPFEQPLIYTNFFSDKNGADLDLLLGGVKIVKRLMKTKALSRVHPKLVKMQVDNCVHLEFDSDDYWRCAIRNLAQHLHHPVGTCKMGPKSDPTEVVNPDLKVHDVEGLRVVDASVMPTIPRCNTNAPTMMIADKAAELVTTEWLRSRDEL